MKNGRLDNLIRDYLSWMIECNRSVRTVDSHKGMLKHFREFAVINGFSIEKAARPETVRAYLADCPLEKAPPAINGFMRYLESKKLTTGFAKIPTRMDNVLEGYMDYYRATRRIGSQR